MGSSAAFGSAVTPAFGSGNFGSGNFGSGAMPSFGSGNFGAGITPSFGSGLTPAFGSGVTPSFGTTYNTPAFGGSSIFSSGSFGGSSLTGYGGAPSSLPGFAPSLASYGGSFSGGYSGAALPPHVSSGSFLSSTPQPLSFGTGASFSSQHPRQNIISPVPDSGRYMSFVDHQDYQAEQFGELPPSRVKSEQMAHSEFWMLFRYIAPRRLYRWPMHQMPANLAMASADILRHWQGVFWLDSASWSVSDRTVSVTPQMMNALLYAKEQKMKRALVLLQRACRKFLQRRHGPRGHGAGSATCARVSAEHGRCKQRTEAGSRYCRLHSCPVCHNEKMSSAPACPAHLQASGTVLPQSGGVCARQGGCHHRAVTGSQFCQLHSCPVCRQEKSSGAQACPAHSGGPATAAPAAAAAAASCGYPGCGQAVMHQSRYCDAHTCPVCHELKSSTTPTCPLHAGPPAVPAPATVAPSALPVTCSHSRCERPAAALSEYCEAHTCPVCRRLKSSNDAACPAHLQGSQPPPTADSNNKCAYKAGCVHSTAGPSRYCQLHSCPVCLQEKGSQAPACALHAPPGTVLPYQQPVQPPPQPGKPEAAAPCLRHEFVPVKVTGMKKCEQCKKLIMGVGSVKCKTCNVKLHTKCETAFRQAHP
eukprot:EG_transcript_4549